MTMLASQITSLTVVYSIVYSGVIQRKHQSSASLAFVREIHRGPVNFPHKWPVTRKMFPFDDVIMCKDQVKCMQPDPRHPEHDNTKQSWVNVSSPRNPYSNRGPFLLTWINLNAIMYKFLHPLLVWDEITYPFPNFNDCTVEVWEWINDLIPHLPVHVIAYPCWD